MVSNHLMIVLLLMLLSFGMACNREIFYEIEQAPNFTLSCECSQDQTNPTYVGAESVTIYWENPLVNWADAYQIIFDGFIMGDEEHGMYYYTAEHGEQGVIFSVNDYLRYNEIHYLTVRAANEFHYYPSERTCYFLIPNPPTPFSVLDEPDSSDRTVQLEWQPSTNADYYELYVAPSTDCSTAISIGQTSDTFMDVNVEGDSNYCFYVIAYTNSGLSQRSINTDTFYINDCPNPSTHAPTNLTPNGGTTRCALYNADEGVQDYTYTFAWDLVTEADGYEFELSTDPGYASCNSSTRNIYKHETNLTNTVNTVTYDWMDENQGHWHIHTDPATPTTVYWRVRSLFTDCPPSDWAEAELTLATDPNTCCPEATTCYDYANVVDSTDLFISEVRTRGNMGNQRGEFIELFNFLDKPLKVSGAFLYYMHGTQASSGWDNPVSLHNYVIASKGWLVVTNRQRHNTPAEGYAFDCYPVIDNPFDTEDSSQNLTNGIESSGCRGGNMVLYFKDGSTTDSLSSDPTVAEFSSSGRRMIDAVSWKNTPCGIFTGDNAFADASKLFLNPPIDVENTSPIAGFERVYTGTHYDTDTNTMANDFFVTNYGMANSPVTSPGAGPW
jgi:hypothetical protein